ncbi:DnaB-like helicase N-terminal domain-containing protein [Nitriliruptor alkaliphilus]|uniref:DnaB-like helicase N-terminal domain-containing protein n=1 Tax=Nitriliruptor alkaliphilus TaxID=427918 RepID=UPI00069914CC|nr:DnaB-like helicase N-terminal domain-containing protein [Nitriliruptor alkaliphilus]
MAADVAAPLVVAEGRTPLASLEAEVSVLGAAMLSRSAAETVVATLTPEVFTRHAHQVVFDAVAGVLGAGDPVDTLTVTEWLARRGQLDEVGGPTALHDLTVQVPSPGNVEAYVTIVREHADGRRLRAEACAVVRDLDAGTPARELRDRLTAAGPAAPSGTAGRAVSGGAFVLDQPDGIPAVWGDGLKVAWSSGEPLLLVGPPGVGKTTLAQQVVLARIGVGSGDVLGIPVEDDGRRVLYVAGDRPRQAARSLRRMVTDADRERLDGRLSVWPGPLPFDVATDPAALVRFVQDHDAGTVVLDSLKDVTPALEKPEVGGQVNLALQACVAAGVEVLGLHHQRKRQAGNARPTKLDDVFGSGWLTAGAGSVLLLWGDAGDPVVELTHLKQPADQLGPWKLVHDHDAGTTTLLDAPDPLRILQAATRGITARTLAQTITGTADPDRSQTERARRHLERLVTSGHAHKHDGNKTTSTPALYQPASLLVEEPHR